MSGRTRRREESQSGLKSRRASCDLEPLDIDAAARRQSLHSTRCRLEDCAGGAQDTDSQCHSSIHNVQEEGIALFTEFLRDEIHSDGLQEPADCSTPFSG